MPDAPSVLADAISCLTRATLAIADVEEKARRDVARSTADADAHRRERDAAAATAHAAQRDAHAARVDAESTRSRADQAEQALAHAREVADTARRDAQAWKEQVARAQDAQKRADDAAARERAALAREVDEWKAQYRRAEKERLRLAARLEEEVSARGRPRTPARRVGESSTSTSSARTKVAASSRPRDYEREPDLSPTAVEDERAPELRRQKRRRASTPARAHTEPHKAAPPASRPRRATRMESDDEPPEAADTDDRPLVTARRRASAVHAQLAPARPGVEVIRRVQAIVYAPVKDESEDGEDVLALGVESGGLFDSGVSPLGDFAAPPPPPSDTRPRTKSGRVVKRVPPPVHSGRAHAYHDVDALSDEDENATDMGEDDDADDALDGDYADDAARPRGRSANRRSNSARRSRPAVQEGGEDELLLRSDVEVRASRASQHSSTDRSRARPRQSATTGSKRKLAHDTPDERSSTASKPRR